MSKSTLTFYDLNDMYYEALRNAVDQETGEIIDQDLFRLLDEIQEEKDRKLLNMACAYKAIQAEADAIEAEEERLKARRKALENQVDSIGSWIKYNAEAGVKIKDPRAEISWRKSSQVIVQIEESDLITKLGERFVKTEITHSPIKADLKKAIEAGEEIPGVWIDSKLNLQIK
ncbi:siphovirus Gp157 family protein [Leptospira santarosai]|uniref:Gam-like protein n=1 Tax=Leptospira santarosai str. ZUN179 TaxID=1049985 RepID=M6UM12_9LEPT|nr:siphovirus Gp157 family protein [Leptospira santarosai]EMO43846.1 Gam-like protein [Leptospira santarosai str. ZUN179]